MKKEKLILDIAIPKELDLTSVAIKNKVLAILKNKKIEGNSFLEIIFVSSQKIHSLNKKYRGVDKPTTVLSFPQINPFHYSRHLGSIVLCLEEIEKIRQLAEGETLELEVLKLIDHGLTNIL